MINLQQSILFMGAGFLGSWTIRLYAQRANAIGIKNNIVVIDNDKFEDRNLPTQYVYPKQMGMYKAMVSADVCDYYGVGCTPIAMRASSDTIDELIEGHNVGLIVDTFDNLESRNICFYLGLSKKIPCVHSALSIRQFGRVEWDDQWSLNPFSLLSTPIVEEVEIPPCELVAFQGIGINIASLTVEEIVSCIGGGVKNNWLIDKDSRKKL